MVVWMPDTIYVMELKVNGPADTALRQINDRGYALQISVGSGRCHSWRRSLPSLAAAAANHVPARCQPKKHGPFPAAVPPAPCLSCAASPECTPFRSSSAMLTCMSSLFSELLTKIHQPTVEKTVKPSPLNSRRSVRPADSRYGLITTLKGSPVLT